MKFNINKKIGKKSKFIVKLDLEEDLEDIKDLKEILKDLEEDLEDLKDSNEDSEDLKDELKKVIEMASFRGIGCKLTEKVGGKIVKSKAKIKVVPKGIIIVSPPENDKRIPWDKIISAERWTHDSLKINLVSDIEGVESPIIYLTNCYSAIFLVDIINDSAIGEDDEGWIV
jgi:ribosomal protein S13